jgi:hypothetical protein
MKEMLRNPMFYYVMVPLCVAFWPVSVWTQYLPEAEDSVSLWAERKVEAETLMLDILRRDPQRLEQNQEKGGQVEFSYAAAVDRVARLCGIRTQQYEVTTRARIGGGDRPETQAASIGLSDVGIEQSANFLWKIQLQWPGLECTGIKLTHKKGQKDVWDVDVEFKYEY